MTRKFSSRFPEGFGQIEEKPNHLEAEYIAHKLDIDFEDAKFICQAVDSHDDLLQALEVVDAEFGELFAGPGANPVYKAIILKVRAALQKAKGETQ